MRRLAHRSYKFRSISKRVTALLLSCMMLILSVPFSSLADETQSELMLNGNFEGYETEHALEGWNTSGDVTAEENEKGTNTYAVLSGGEELAVLQSDKVNVKSGTYYKVSFDVRAKSQSVFRAKVLQYRGDVALEDDDIAISVTELDADWTGNSYVFLTGHDTNAVAIYFENSDGSVDVDQVSLREYAMKSKASKATIQQMKSTNLFTNHAFTLSNGVQVGDKDFAMATGFADGNFKWVAQESEVKQYKNWEVAEDATYGHVFKITQHTTNANSGVYLGHNIAWEAGVTYEISYKIKASFASAASVNVRQFFPGIVADGQTYLANNGNQTAVPTTLNLENYKGTTWEPYSFEFTPTTGQTGQLRFHINTRYEGVSLYIADVKVVPKVQEETGEATNLFTNHAFTLSNGVKVGDKDFAMATGFADGNFKWVAQESEVKQYKNWEVAEDATYGNVFKITQHTTNANSGVYLGHNIAWEAGVTYEISYKIKASFASAASVNVRQFFPGIVADGQTYLANNGNQTAVPTTLNLENYKGTEWQTYSFEFTPTTGQAGQLRFHINTRYEGVALYIADVKVVPKVQEESGDSENLFTNHAFTLSNGVKVGDKDFAMTTGFADGKFKWVAQESEVKQYKNWEVAEDATYGKVFKITQHTTNSNSGVYIGHDIAWEAGVTYEISYKIKASFASAASVNVRQFFPGIVADGQTYLANNGNQTAVPTTLNLENYKGTEWQTYSFEFTPTTGQAGQLRFHINTRYEGVSLYLADVKVVAKPVTPKRLDNGNFAAGTKSWEGFTTADLFDGVKGGAESGSVLTVSGGKQIYHDAFTEALEIGKKYTLTFRMRNDALSGADLGSVYLAKKDGTGKTADMQLVATNAVWKTYSVNYVAEEGYENPQLCIDLKDSNVNYTFADFTFDDFTSILSNGDFLNELTDWKFEPIGRTDNPDTNKNNSTYEIVNDPTYGKAVKISKPKTDENATDLRHLALTEPLELGKVYRISYMIKTTGTTDDDAKFYMLLRQSFGGGAAQNFEEVGATNGEWKQITAEWTPTEEMLTPSLWLRMDTRINSSLDVTDYYIANVKIEVTDKKASGGVGVQNGSFFHAVHKYPEDWGLLLGEGADVTADSAGAGKEDKGLVTVEKNGTGIAGVSTLATTYANVNNQLSFWLQANAAARAGLKLRATYYADSSRSAVLKTDYIALTIAAQDDWQQVKPTFQTPAGAGYVDLSFYVDGSATGAKFELDNVQMSLDQESEKNFNFEIGGTTPLSWTLGGKGTLTREPVSHDGSYAAKITDVSGGSLQSIKFPVEGGANYELSYWIKTTAGFDFFVEPSLQQWNQEGGNATSITYDNKAPYTKETNMINFPWTFRTYGASEWRLVKTYFVAADDAATAQLKLTFSGAATEILIDNVSIIKKETAANLDFENTDTNGTPEGWYLTGARDTVATIQTSTERYHSGNSSMYLKMNNVVREQQVISSHLIPITDEGDTRIYEASYWVASKGSNMKSVRLDLWCYNEAGIKIYTSSVGVTDPSVKGIQKTLNGGSEVSEWSQGISRVAVPKDAAYVSLVFTLTQGAAEVWIDDVFFDQVESDTQVVAAHNDFHAVDQDGLIFGWEAVGNATLTQQTEKDADAERTFGQLTVAEGGGSMKYRTTVMGTDYGYALAIKYRSDYALDLQTKYYDYQENEYTDAAKSYTLPASDQWHEEVITFTAPSATYADFLIGMKNAGTFDVAQIILYQTNKPQTKMTWEGRWISYREDFRYCAEYASSYYRRTITLEDKPVTAPLQITGDDKFAIYVNGKLFFSNIEDPTASWATVGILDLADVLKKGENIIAIEVANQGAYSALLYDGRWEMPNGDIFKFMSGKETMALGGKSLSGTDWTKLNYDEEANGWDKAIEVGDVPMNPWGDLPYDSSLYIDNLIELQPVKGEGDLVNDLVYDFSVKIKLEKEITSQLPFSVVLWRKNSTKSICSLSTTLLDHKDMTAWPVNEWFTVKMRVELPDYLEDGNYTLQLSNTYFAVTSEDIFDNRFISFKVVNDYQATDLVTKVENMNGTPTFTVNGDPVPAFYFLTSFLNSASALDTIGNSGIETYINYSTLLGKFENTPGLWDENGSIDFEYLDNNINSILSASTEANLIVSIGMYAPEWWLAENPGEAATSVDINGKVTTSTLASFGSEKWNKESGEILKQIIAHMKEQSYYSRIAGIRLIGGQTYEFITAGAQSSDSLPDYSDAALEYFRKWAKNEYQTIENLREAWNDPTIESFDKIEFPTFAEMKESGGTGMLYNPETQQKQIDFRLLLGEMTADALIYWAKCAKEATDNKLVVGAYYGYLNMGSNWTGLGAEHSVFDRVLACEDLDFFASPVGYNERQLGESIYAQSVADSMRAYGKLYIAEQDNRTVLTGQFAGAGWSTSRDDSIGQTHTMEDTLLQEKRDAIYNLTQGNGEWLFDMQGGWINDEQIYEFTNDMNAEFNFANYLEKDTVNDIALIMADENTAYFRTSQSTDGDGVMSNQTVIGQYMYMWHRKQLNQIGAGYDTYALSTLVDGKMPEHKINVFFSPYVLSEEEREAIDKYCKNNGQINIFLYLSGWGDEDGYDLDNMTDLTGFEYELISGTKSAGQVTVTNGTSDITSGLQGTNFGAQVSTTKYMLDEISVKDTTSDMTVLGILSDSGKIGLASKDMGEWTSIYCAAPQISAEIYRNLLKKSGAHIYSENRSDVVTSNGAYVGVHSAASGAKEILLDGNYAVYDVFEEKYISLDTNVINYTNKVNDTHLFRLTPANTYSFLSIVKGGHGSISAEGLEQLSPGSSKKLTLTPDEGYMIKSITINGKNIEIPKDNVLTFDNINENNTIVVRYKRVPVNRTLDEEIENEIGSVGDLVDDDTPIEDEVPIFKKVKQLIERWGTQQKILHIAAWVIVLIVVLLIAIAVTIYLLMRWWKKTHQ